MVYRCISPLPALVWVVMAQAGKYRIILSCLSKASKAWLARYQVAKVTFSKNLMWVVLFSKVTKDPFQKAIY